jgi:hypothetical protein
MNGLHDSMPKAMQKVPCSKCGALILPVTAERTGGLCMPCFNPERERDTAGSANQDLLQQILKHAKPYEPVRGPGRSIIELIANPEELHGQRVRVIGYVLLEREGTMIYLSEHDAKHGISKNAIWLSIPSGSWQDCYKCHAKYALVEGTYSAKHLGHKDACSGAIEEIVRFEPWH